MTLEDFNNIVDSYGLYKRNGYISLSGFFEKDTCGDAPVVTFYVKVKKLEIYLDLDNNTGNMKGGYIGGLILKRPHVMVSEVTTANYILKELFKKRKKILVDKKLKEINRDFT